MNSDNKMVPAAATVPERAEQFFDRIAQNKNASIDFLQKAGILDDDGELAEPYREDDPPRKRIDANELERMAKARPNERFLKGSGVLKLTGAIRQLEGELRAARAALSTPTAQKAEGGEVPAGYVTAIAEGKVLMLPRPSLNTNGMVPLYARPTPAAAAGVPPDLLDLLREIRPMADYGRVGTRDIDQGRFQRALDSAIAVLAASGAPAGAPTEGEQQ